MSPVSIKNENIIDSLDVAEVYGRPARSKTPLPSDRVSSTPPGQAFARLIKGIEHQGQQIDRALGRARRGQDLPPLALLSLQSKIYSHSLSMELASKLVDRTVSSVKTTLNTQV